MYVWEYSCVCAREYRYAHAIIPEVPWGVNVASLISDALIERNIFPLISHHSKAPDCIVMLISPFDGHRHRWSMHVRLYYELIIHAHVWVECRQVHTSTVPLFVVNMGSSMHRPSLTWFGFRYKFSASLEAWILMMANGTFWGGRLRCVLRLCRSRIMA